MQAPQGWPALILLTSQSPGFQVSPDFMFSVPWTPRLFLDLSACMCGFVAKKSSPGTYFKKGQKVSDGKFRDLECQEDGLLGAWPSSLCKEGLGLQGCWRSSASPFLSPSLTSFSPSAQYCYCGFPAFQARCSLATGLLPAALWGDGTQLCPWGTGSGKEVGRSLKARVCRFLLENAAFPRSPLCLQPWSLGPG